MLAASLRLFACSTLTAFLLAMRPLNAFERERQVRRDRVSAALPLRDGHNMHAQHGGAFRRVFNRWLDDVRVVFSQAGRQFVLSLVRSFPLGAPM